MTIDITSFFFNSSIEGATATSAWGTSIGQNASKSCRIEDAKPGVTEMLTGMLYKSIPDKSRLDISAGSPNREVLLFSKFDKVFVNGTQLEDQSFVILLVRENSESHKGRLLISYPPYAKIDEVAVNDMAIKEMASALGCTEDGCWFVHDISVVNQDELHFSAIVVNAEHPMIYKGKSKDRSRAWNDMVANEGITTRTGREIDTIKDLQKIFYGCPGTGKSHTVMEQTEGIEGEKRVYFDPRGRVIDDIQNYKDKSQVTSNIFRTTFHPDYDYSSFVGSYKPIMKPVFDEDGNQVREDVSYSFVPQVFIDAYVRAWKSLADESLSESEKQVFLIIEEINRGNCAQIFGDLFQLLDRKKGFSEYSIVPDSELRKYLEEQGLDGDRLALPCNMHILATMNTSDQSLFPMDSAFKRRWEMEYIPINLKHNLASTYTIEFDGHKFMWTDFLKAVNTLIRKATDSEDKQMGEFFVKNKVINLAEFKNKVLFYIWNDVCKDLYGASRVSPLYFMRDTEKTIFTFAELYSGRTNDDETVTEPIDLILGFMSYLKVEDKGTAAKKDE